MSFEIKGVEELLKKMESELGERKVSRVANKALNEAGEEFKEGLAKAVASYSNGSNESTGATADEIVIGRASKRGGRRTVKVGWNGPKKRYKLVHLNEFGYTRWGKTYSPRGSGVIRKYIDVAGQQYILNVRRGLEELAK